MITCIGSIALDTTRTPNGTVKDEPGGSAAYFSLAASLLSEVSVVSAVGGDFPNDFLEKMRKKGIDLSGVQISRKEKTFRYHSTFSQDFSDRSSDLTQLNVFEKFEPKLSQKQAKSKFAYLGTLTPALQLSVLSQLEKPKFVAMDTIWFFIKNDLAGVKKVLSKVDCAILNDAEARMLCGKNNLVSCGKELLREGPDYCVIKKGEHGSMLFCADGSVNPYPGYPLENIVDPTGAGDSFAGGFMGCIAKAGEPKKADLRKAMAWGTVAGSIAVEGFGTSSIMQADYASARKRYDAYRALMHFEESL